MNVAIVGATGYGGVELIRLLKQHPYVTIKTVISTSQSGTPMAEVYPHLTGIIEQTLESLDVEKLAKEVDFVFFATPAGVSKELIPQFVERGVRCIDVSGDFRLKDGAAYREWYKKEPAEEQYLQQAVYGLSEFFAEEIKRATILANPGCYPTATLLGLMPLVQEDLIETDSIIIDAKSGVSGAGRGVSLGTHFCEVNENVKAYKLGVHQHTPEIEQALEWASKGKEIRVTFSTHLIPMTRGIMSTMYVQLKEPKTTQEMIQFYEEFYREHPFIRIRPEGHWPSTREVYGSNYCDMGFMSDPRTNRLTIVSVIDNMVKGAAGQAIQNLNLMNGWPVTTGLTLSPVYP